MRNEGRRSRSLRGPALLVLAASMCVPHLGCVMGSLASSTGPRSKGHQWSTASKQMVQVAETVTFDFVLHDWVGRFMPPLGVADYCVLEIDGKRLETQADSNGHFQFSYTFDDVSPGNKLKVAATAYLLRGARDYMKLGDRWHRGDSPYDEPDRRVARDTIRLATYESPVDLVILRPGLDLDPQRGVLRIRNHEGTSRTVFFDRPGRPGFSFEGPDADGYYRIRFTPAGNELNATGTTDIEFTIYDARSEAHRVTATIKTP